MKVDWKYMRTCCKANQEGIFLKLDDGNALIASNGSKWAGESPDPIQRLIDTLSEYHLDPTFEDYGNFVIDLDKPEEWDDPEQYKKYPNIKRFFGNFQTLSHVFSIDTDSPTLIDKLTKAIRVNQNTARYEKAVSEYNRCDGCGGLTICADHATIRGEYLTDKCFSQDEHRR